MPVLTGWAGHGVDVAIVGAGAAGIAAALHLGARRPDLSIVVIEAAPRLGGRAWTLPGPMAVDMGCGWLHGATTNVWTHIGEARGFVIDKVPAPWSGGTRQLGLTPQDKASADDAIQRYFDRIDGRSASAPDVPLSNFLEADGRWNGLIGAIGTFINGVELAEASTVDYERYEPGPPPDWRVRDGYGRLIATCGADVPVVLDAAVERITYTATSHLTLQTTRGPLRSRAAIVTVSSNLMASDAIRFDPALPAKRSAAESLPLGLADKLFLSVEHAEDLPFEGHILGNPQRVGTAAYHVRPFGRPVIEAYFGGALAHDMERAGREGAFEFAAEELCGIFGAAIRPRLSVLSWSSWAQNQWARGSYSYAKPGQADARTVLAEPVEDRLFFAGEACSPTRFSTAHGAFESGVTAADQAIQAL